MYNHTHSRTSWRHDCRQKSVIAGVRSKPSAAVIIHVPSAAASSFVFSRCLSGSDCLLFQSQFTSSPQLLGSAGREREEGKGRVGLKEVRRHRNSLPPPHRFSSFLNLASVERRKDEDLITLVGNSFSSPKET